MQNIKIPQRVGNSITKHAYLELIADSIRKITRYNGLSHIEMGGYDRDEDRVQFRYGGKRCILYGAWIPAIDDPSKPDIITLQVKARVNGTTDVYDLPIDIRDFRFKTLDRIAYEVYDYCKGENDDDYETAIKEYIADEMDNYREFMS
jgi:hypothetical protein